LPFLFGRNVRCDAILSTKYASCMIL
jgi:hypothetical protein